MKGLAIEDELRKMGIGQTGHPVVVDTLFLSPKDKFFSCANESSYDLFGKYIDINTYVRYIAYNGKISFLSSKKKIYKERWAYAILRKGAEKKFMEQYPSTIVGTIKNIITGKALLLKRRETESLSLRGPVEHEKR